MKFLLIFLNIVLAGILLYGVSKQFSANPFPAAAKSVPEKTAVGNTPVKSEHYKITVRTAEEQQKSIAANNIFDLSRVSGAYGSRGGQTTLTLVGTVQMGSYSGAIVLQSTARSRNFGPPGMPNFGRNNSSATEEKDYSFKQFMRVGETASNGYTLVSVTANSAVLTRGGERLELALQEASKNAPQAQAQQKNNQTAPPTPTVQDAMMMQMFQNMQMMRMMQRVMQQQQRASGNSSVSGRRGGSSSTSGSSGFGGGMGGGSRGGGRR